MDTVYYHLSAEYKKIKRMNITKQKQTDIENKLVVTHGEEETGERQGRGLGL